jgi:hypothetical protein
MDGGSLLDFLRTVEDFLQGNIDEVLTLLFVNTGVPLASWAKAFFEARLDLFFIQPAREQKTWPDRHLRLAHNRPHSREKQPPRNLYLVWSRRRSRSFPPARIRLPLRNGFWDRAAGSVLLRSGSSAVGQ